MSINRQTAEAASLQIGPTSEGMVRLYVEAEGFDLPMDFEPEEAEEIAEELIAAARRARGAGGTGQGDQAKSGKAKSGTDRAGKGSGPGRPRKS